MHERVIYFLLIKKNLGAYTHDPTPYVISIQCKDGKLKVKLDNDNEKTFRLIKECDLQLYEGGPLSFSSESQTEETSFEY